MFYKYEIFKLYRGKLSLLIVVSVVTIVVSVVTIVVSMVVVVVTTVSLSVLVVVGSGVVHATTVSAMPIINNRFFIN